MVMKASYQGEKENNANSLYWQTKTTLSIKVVFTTLLADQNNPVHTPLLCYGKRWLDEGHLWHQ